jgi:Glycosyltransferase 61
MTVPRLFDTSLKLGGKGATNSIQKCIQRRVGRPVRCPLFSTCLSSVAGQIAFAAVMLLGVGWMVNAVSTAVIIQHARRVHTTLGDISGAFGGVVAGKADERHSVSDATTQNETAIENAGSSNALRVYRRSDRNRLRMCRIPNACVDTSGHIYVPNVLQSLKQVLDVKCRLNASVMSFYDPDGDELMRNEKVTSHFPSEHVLGSKLFRYHMPHMMQDFLALVMPFAPYLQRKLGTAYGDPSPPFLPPKTTVQCYDAMGVSRGVPCSSSPPRHVSVLVEERGRTFEWVSGLFRLLGPKTSRVPLRPMFSADVFPHLDMVENEGTESPQGRRACFGSLSVSAEPRRLSIRGFGKPADLFEKSVLFAHNGIQRRVPVVKRGSHCSLNVTIVNRPFKVGSRVFPDGARRISNVRDLQAALYEESQRLGISVVVTERADFSSVGILEQFEVMQNTQILVSVHGAELSNVFFLRRGVSVTEVFPFRYTPTIFVEIMRALGIHHETYVAKPDVDSYSKCVYHFYREGNPLRDAAEFIVRQFKERAASISTVKDDDELISVGSYWDWKSNIPNERRCGRSQRLVVDADALAKRALRTYRRVCYGDEQDGASGVDL